jgi:predicted nucleic acid-binding protein
MDDSRPVYVIDTSIWIELLRIVPLPGIWEWLNSLMTDGRIVIPREVVCEFGNHGADLHRWVENHKGAHRPTEGAVWDVAVELANEFQDLVDTAKTGECDADAFVIATAIIEKETRAQGTFPCEVVVVTMEKNKMPGKVTIRDACDARGVACANLAEWFQMDGFRFGPAGTT